jgi:hypothetical protein
LEVQSLGDNVYFNNNRRVGLTKKARLLILNAILLPVAQGTKAMLGNIESLMDTYFSTNNWHLRLHTNTALKKSLKCSSWSWQVHVALTHKEYKVTLCPVLVAMAGGAALIYGEIVLHMRVRDPILK